ncbi:MAG TPA: 4-aminobutyrate--2-oxoglutarate transaminase [Chloroflexota bacterium]|nr:4-aminobutyrate--2-oxoglutarate transaminase [Chloroflexota bacterium]
MTIQTGSRVADAQTKRNKFVARGISTYAPGVVVDHARGAEIWDVDGKRYIDFVGGIGVLNVGHTPPTVVDAIRRQSEKLIHTCFSVAYYEPYLDLCERLVAVTPGRFEKKVALFNSGAEAVENAVKMARSFTGRAAIVAFENAFHGRTMMAMTLTGKERPYREGFGPFAPDVHHARFPYGYRCDCGVHAAAVDNTPGPDSDPTCPIENGDDLETVLERIGAANVAAVIVEPVQGEGGFVVAPSAWLRKVREICTREGIVMIADEIQTGFGRTGAMFAVEHSDVEPDVILMAKSLAAGLPLSAVVGRAEVLDGPGLGGVGGTYGGNPVACAAALAVLDIFEDEHLVEKGNRLGEAVAAHFSRLAGKHALVGEVRGLGAMQAMELVVDRHTKEPAASETSDIIHACHLHGLLIIKAGTYDNVIRFLAPLTISQELLEKGLDILDGVMGEVAVTC